MSIDDTIKDLRAERTRHQEAMISLGRQIQFPDLANLIRAGFDAKKYYNQHQFDRKDTPESPLDFSVPTLPFECVLSPHHLQMHYGGIVIVSYDNPEVRALYGELAGMVADIAEDDFDLS